MNVKIFDFYNSTAKLKFKKKVEDFTKKYSIVSMDNEDKVISRFDVFNINTLETIVEIYINNATYFVVLDSKRFNTKVGIQPKRKDLFLTDEELSIQHIAKRIVWLKSEGDIPLEYNKEKHCINDNKDCIFEHFNSQKKPSSDMLKLNKRLLSIFVSIKFAYASMKYPFNRIKDIDL